MVSNFEKELKQTYFHGSLENSKKREELIKKRKTKMYNVKKIEKRLKFYLQNPNIPGIPR